MVLIHQLENRDYQEWINNNNKKARPNYVAYEKPVLNVNEGEL